MRHLLLAGVASVAFASAAVAADMPAPPPMEEAFVEPATAWDGWFAGIQGGYGWGEVDYFFTEPGGISSIDDPEGSLDIEGPAGGLYYGRNWQFDSWVVGLEGSLSAADIGEEFSVTTDTDPIDGEVSIDFFTTSRAKVGYAFDNVMIFAAGGLSVAHFDAEFSNEFVGDDDEWAFGWTVGAGVEAKLAENWSARVEYLYLAYEEETLFDGLGAEVDVDVDMHVVRGGIAYHF